MPDDPTKVPADSASNAPSTETERRAGYGRKFAIIIVSLIVFAVIVCFKSDITGKDALQDLIWLVAIGTGSIALEDGIGKIRGK